MREPIVYSSIGPTSPFEPEEFNVEDPYDLAARISSWRPDMQEGPSPPSALGICHNLEDAVKGSPDMLDEGSGQND